jgi:hypothetical protein
LLRCESSHLLHAPELTSPFQQYIPLYFQFVHSDSAITAAVRLLPFICVLIFTVLLNGALMPVFGYYMPWYTASGAFMLVGGALMYTVDSTSSTSAIYGYSILIAIGTGCGMQGGYSIASAKVKASDVPAAIGFMNCGQLGTGVIALGIAGSVFQNVGFQTLKTALDGMGFSSEEIRSALTGTQSVVFQHGSADVRARALGAVVQTMDKIYIMVITAGALALILSLFLKREKLFMAPVSAG